MYNLPDDYNEKPLRPRIFKEQKQHQMFPSRCIVRVYVVKVSPRGRLAQTDTRKFPGAPLTFMLLSAPFKEEYCAENNKTVPVSVTVPESP